MTTRNLPDPTMSFADWLVAIKDERPFVVADYFNGAPESVQRKWIIAAGICLCEGMNVGVISPDLRVTRSGKKNHFSMADEARRFWNESIANGMSPEAILTAWKEAHPPEEKNP